MVMVWREVTFGSGQYLLSLPLMEKEKGRLKKAWHGMAGGMAGVMEGRRHGEKCLLLLKRKKKEEEYVSCGIY